MAEIHVPEEPQSNSGNDETNADHDEKGTVDIKDLLLVIHNWGLSG